MILISKIHILNSAYTFKNLLKKGRKTQFYDLSRYPQGARKPKSKALFLYSAYDNIGNYTPLLGMSKMLGYSPDTWNFHLNLDWEYVNKNYKALVFGGAGLLHGGFSKKWEDVRENCQIPIAVWGIGGCFPRASLDSSEPVPLDASKNKLDN